MSAIGKTGNNTNGFRFRLRLQTQRP